ncbi:MAG: hypothetical protein JJ921_13990 [Pseudomonadales bacterium]|nr:hypothetical protein [Pseudomonadales bacterium]MBO7004551.1 hypothetical protein [Pseudomonadales bacterium]
MMKRNCPKKTYQRPQLRRHGRISRVTASGSGKKQEMAAMGMMDESRFS